MEIKRRIVRVWRFIWEEDSVWSWIINVVLAFLIIKFLLYPGLGWVLGTPAPIVAVVSGSMEHDGYFERWWVGSSCCDDECKRNTIQANFYKDIGITMEDFRGFPFVNGFNKGDIMILVGAGDVRVGDVVVYNVEHRSDPIIHRVIRIEDGVFATKGDHNCAMADFEHSIPKDKVIGKAVWRVPFLGWVKIIFVDAIHLFGG